MIAAAAAPYLSQEALEFLLVGAAQRPGFTQNLRQILHALEEGRILKRKVDLGRVENLEDHHFVSAMPEMLESREQVRHLIEQVAQDDDEPAFLEAFGQIMKDARYVCGVGSGGDVQGV